MACAGVNLAFPSTNATLNRQVLWTILRYDTALIAISETLQKVCSSMRAEHFNASVL